MTAEAWRLNTDRLEKLWSYSNRKLPRKWWGQGAHTTRAADLDGDGKDEVALKGSDWSEGDWREQEGVNKGKVLAGPEYLLVLEGATGREIARAPWPCREHFFDGYMGDNYAARNQIALFRPDG